NEVPRLCNKRSQASAGTYPYQLQQPNALLIAACRAVAHLARISRPSFQLLLYGYIANTCAAVAQASSSPTFRKECHMKKLLLAAAFSLLAASAFAAVDVNKAPEGDLDSIKGIGPNTSAKIIEQRKSAP